MGIWNQGIWTIGIWDFGIPITRAYTPKNQGCKHRQDLRNLHLDLHIYVVNHATSFSELYKFR